MELRLYPVVGFMSVRWRNNLCENWFAVGGIFTNNRDILIAIERHREGSWYGRRSHHENVGDDSCEGVDG